MSGKLLRCRAKSEDFSRKLLPRFTLSEDLYRCTSAPDSTREVSASPPTSTPEPEPASTILNLPAEILSQIYTTLLHAPTQIAFALTCKRLAQIASHHDLNLSMTSPKYAGFLPREVFDVPALMQSLTSWMPPTLKLCDHCLTMRPCDTTYWADIAGCEAANFWITKTGWAFADASWHKQVHDICPACHVTCSLSDYVDCDGCRALGRLGDVDWSRISDPFLRRAQQEVMAVAAATTAIANLEVGSTTATTTTTTMAPPLPPPVAVSTDIWDNISGRPSSVVTTSSTHQLQVRWKMSPLESSAMTQIVTQAESNSSRHGRASLGLSSHRRDQRSQARLYGK